MAGYLAELLDASEHPSDLKGHHMGRKPAWLRAFLRDESEWEPRLRAWIARVLGE